LKFGKAFPSLFIYLEVGEGSVPMIEYRIPSFATGSSPKIFEQESSLDTPIKTRQNDMPKKTLPPKSDDNFGKHITSLQSADVRPF